MLFKKKSTTKNFRESVDVVRDKNGDTIMADKGGTVQVNVTKILRIINDLFNRKVVNKVQFEEPDLTLVNGGRLS